MELAVQPSVQSFLERRLTGQEDDTQSQLHSLDFRCRCLCSRMLPSAGVLDLDACDCGPQQTLTRVLPPKLYGSSYKMSYQVTVAHIKHSEV